MKNPGACLFIVCVRVCVCVQDGTQRLRQLRSGSGCQAHKAKNGLYISGVAAHFAVVGGNVSGLESLRLRWAAATRRVTPNKHVSTSSPGPGKLPGGVRLVWLQYCGPHQVQVGLAAVLWAYVKPSGTSLVKRAADTST